METVGNGDTRSDRITWVDALKFLGIFAIYLGHFTEAGGRLYPFVFTYHVPLFFFVGGFFASRYTPIGGIKAFFRRESGFILRKLRRLILPYFVFSLITVFILTIANDSQTSGLTLLGHLKEMLLGRREHIIAYPLWFFTCLFMVTILHRYLILIFRNPWAILVLSFFVNIYSGELMELLHIKPLSLFFNLDSTLVYLFYFAAGQCLFPYFAKLAHWKHKPSASQSITIVVLLLLSGLVTASVYFSGGGFTYILLDKLGWTKVFGRCLYTIQAMFLISCQYIISIFVSRLSFIVAMGRESLTLCGTELITKTVLASCLSILGVNIYQSLTTPLVTVCYTGLCCLTSYYCIAVLLRKRRTERMQMAQEE